MDEQPVAGWYTDPTGRFEHRYWDGTSWTEHVSRQGQATVDALDGSTVHAETTPAAATSGDGDPAASWSPSADGAGWSPTPGGPSWMAGTATTTNAKAVVSLVLSLLWLGGLGSAAAIVLGVMARRELEGRADETGRGLATAGLVLGILGVLGTVLVLFAVAAFVSFGA